MMRRTANAIQLPLLKEQAYKAIAASRPSSAGSGFSAEALTKQVISILSLEDKDAQALKKDMNRHKHDNTVNALHQIIYNHLEQSKDLSERQSIALKIKEGAEN